MFASRVQALIEASGGRVQPGSGYRTYEEQARLYELYKAGKGNLAAPPGHSNHNHGLAMDLRGDLEWAHQNAHRFGLHFPLLDQDEPWHVEPIGVDNPGGITFTGTGEPIEFNTVFEPDPTNPEDALGARLDAIMQLVVGGVPEDFAEGPDEPTQPATLGTTVTELPGGEPTTMTTEVAGEVADPTGMGEYARARLAEMGFGESEYRALVWLWNKESGDPKERHEVTWNPQARNPRASPSLTDAGIAQKNQEVHGPVEDTWQGQITWGLDYILDRYGSPTRALAFHRENGWY